MRRIVWLVALCVALLTSCLELEQTITLRADGSGTQHVKMGMTESGLASARAFAQASEVAFIVDPARIYDAGLVRRELTTAGMVCRDIKTYEERRRRFVEVTAEFSGLDALRKSPLLGGFAEWKVRAGKQPHSVSLVLYPRGEKAWKQARDKAGKMASQMTERERSYFARARGRMQGLEVVLHLDLPGDVLARTRNLRLVGKRRVSAVIDAASIRAPRDLVRLLAPRYEVVFDGRGSTLLAGGSSAGPLRDSNAQVASGL